MKKENQHSHVQAPTNPWQQINQACGREGISGKVSLTAAAWEVQKQVWILERKESVCILWELCIVLQKASQRERKTTTYFPHS